MVHGKKKRCLEAYFAVNVKTEEIVAMKVTTDDGHDSKVLPKLIGKGKHAKIWGI